MSAKKESEGEQLREPRGKAAKRNRTDARGEQKAVERKRAIGHWATKNARDERLLSRRESALTAGES